MRQYAKSRRFLGSVPTPPLPAARYEEVMHAATGLWLCLLGLVPGPGIAPGAAAPVEARDELVEFLEFLNHLLNVSVLQLPPYLQTKQLCMISHSILNNYGIVFQKM